jgi:hypothetical protein
MPGLTMLMRTDATRSAALIVFMIVSFLGSEPSYALVHTGSWRKK